MSEDREILTHALESAGRLYRERNPQRTILGADPDSSVMEPLSEAIDKCTTFRAAKGYVLYTGGSGPTITATWLAKRLFEKGARWDQDTTGAVDWLLRVLTTRETLGLFKTAVWGLSVDTETAFPDSSRLLPFAELPDSFMKGRISERSKPCYDNSIWLAHNYFDLPRAAFVTRVPNFPYIGSDLAAFEKIAQLQHEAREFWEFFAGASLGHPLAVGCWFEYEDHELDFEQWQNALAWILPEIPPRIAICTATSGASLYDDRTKYMGMPSDLRSDLLRSMNRFTLSQCRHQLIDRILDLALAFEIAVSSDGGQAPPSWKVAVRTAQLIGGALKIRQHNRAAVTELYKLRNKLTHGSRLRGGVREEQEQIVLQCSELYRTLIRSFVYFGQKPDWNSLELEPRSTR
jgi:hypothetical protein